LAFASLQYLYQNKKGGYAFSLGNNYYSEYTMIFQDQAKIVTTVL